MNNTNKSEIDPALSPVPEVENNPLVFEEDRSKFSFKKFKGSKKWMGLFLVGFLVVAVFASVKLAQMYVNFKSGATLGQSDFFFTPSSATITSTTSADIKVFATTTVPVSFVRTEITFNPSLVQLVSDPELTNTNLTRRIRWTSASEANTSGKISLVVGMEPSNRDNAPSGSFELAKLKFIARSTTTGSLTLGFDRANMQVVTSSSQETAMTSQTASLALNPASPVPSPSLSASSTPTSSPSQSSNPKTSPTSSSTPSLAPSPSLVPSPTANSCSKCYRGVCDGVCTRGRDKTGCGDCP